MFGVPFVNDKKWPNSTLGEACTYLTDGSHYSPEDNASGKYPMLTVKNMTDTGFDYSDCKHIGDVEYQKMVANGCKPLKNDVLVAKDGSYFKTAFVIDEEVDQAVLSSIAILRPNTDLLVPRFLREYLMSNDVVTTVGKEYVTGTAIRRVILKKLKTMPVYLPPVELQRKYVEFVEQSDKSKYSLGGQLCLMKQALNR